MAKRFIDTGIFRKPSIRAMKAPYKALFIYLLCECDHAGIWDVEIDVAEARLGMRLDADKAIKEMGGAVVEVAQGKWYLVDFVEFQYGNLNPANRVHASVMARLQSLNVDPENKPLVSPLKGAKDKDKDKDKDIQEGKERARDDRELNWPVWGGPKCRAKWAEFVAYRVSEKKLRYKTVATEQRALDLAARYFPSGPDFVSALDHTMARTWAFPVDPSEHKYPDMSKADGKPSNIKPWMQ